MMALYGECDCCHEYKKLEYTDSTRENFHCEECGDFPEEPVLRMAHDWKERLNEIYEEEEE
jgi:hypothetical protein